MSDQEDCDRVEARHRYDLRFSISVFPKTNAKNTHTHTHNSFLPPPSSLLPPHKCLQMRFAADFLALDVV